jgi:hypothetical protein
MTFAQARTNLIAFLSAQGWTTNMRSAQGVPLKTPHATSPDGSLRLWFKPQALWISASKGHHELGNARSTWIDIRAMAPSNIVHETTKFYSGFDK